MLRYTAVLDEQYFYDFLICMQCTLMLGRDKSGCGTVISEHHINRGAEKRNFEGEEVSEVGRERACVHWGRAVYGCTLGIALLANLICEACQVHSNSCLLDTFPATFCLC